MADYAVANGAHCYYCDSARCICDRLETASWAAVREENRTARLLRAIDAAEARIVFLESLAEFHPLLPEARERYQNLTTALVNHRRAEKGLC